MIPPRDTPPHRAEVTILATDLTRFSRFVEVAEPEQVMRVLGDMHRLFEEIVIPRGGWVMNQAGDSVFFVFNDPVVVEDPEARAVRAALEVRARLEPLTENWQRMGGHRMSVKIGVHAGFATIGWIGVAGHEDYGPVGRTVFLAAICVRHAKPGQIIVTQRVRGAVEREIEFEPAGETTGGDRLERPMPVFNVVGERAR